MVELLRSPWTPLNLLFKIHVLTCKNMTIMVYVEFGAHISATFISANTTRRRQSQRLFKLAPSNTALTHFGDLHFSEHNSALPITAPIQIGAIEYSAYTFRRPSFQRTQLAASKYSAY